MSLESSISDLTTHVNSLIDYFNTKKAGIDSAVAAAIAAVPVNKKTYYVDQLNGLDTNDGGISSPLQTIEQALKATPVGGICSIRLQSDYDMHPALVTIEGISLELRTDTIGIKRVVRPCYFKSEDGLTTFISCFSAVMGAQFSFRDITFELPSADGQTPAAVGGDNTLMKVNTTSPAPVLPIKLINCDVTDLSGANAYLALSSVSALLLGVVDTTFPADFAGRYIYGIAADTISSTVPLLVTNLTSL